MKKIFLFVFLMISFHLVMFAQPDSTRNNRPMQLSNLEDSANYAIGISIANFYKSQGITQLNTDLITKAIRDIYGGSVQFDDNIANNVMNNYMTMISEKKSKGNIDSGMAFLNRNKLRPQVKTTQSGLQYEVITEGSGASPVSTDSVTVHYRGTFLNGEIFDESYRRGQPITFLLTQVIAGWTEGLQLMKPGSKYKFYVPHTLGYGMMDYGAIPGGSTLVFEVELLRVAKPGAKTQPATKPPATQQKTTTPKTTTPKTTTPKTSTQKPATKNQ